MITPRSVFLIAVMLLICLAGCNHSPPAANKAAEPTVDYVLPVEDLVREYEVFNGRTAAVDSVDIRARVGGYLMDIKFEDGALVQQGDLLFQLDDRGYQAEVDRAEASLEQLRVRIERLRKQDSRAQQLLQSNTISQDAFELLHSELNESLANLGVVEANLSLAKLNLEYTKVQAPISGMISRRLVDKGNLVRADESLLATIVTTDPLYVYFDMNERTVLKTRRLQYEGQTTGEAGTKVEVGLADESGFAHEAVVDYLDNQVDRATGTLRLRAKLANPNNLLTSGLFVRLRYPIGQPHKALLIPEESLATDQGQRCVYVVDADEKIAYRRVGVGALENGRRAILSGLQANERVVLKGLQRVRSGDKVKARLFESSAGETVGPDKTDTEKTAAVK